MLNLFLFFPEAMEIAVLVSCYALVAVCEDELCLGLVAGLEVLSQDAVLGLEEDPFDIVVFKHRMGNFAYGYGYLVSFNGDYRNVLFGSGIGGVCSELGHRLSAAHDGAGALLEQLYHISALTLKDPHFTSLLYQ